MKSTLFIISIFLAFTNACNQNKADNSSGISSSEKTESIKNVEPIKNEVVSDTKIEKTQAENTVEKTSEQKKEYFTLLGATSQSWTAGIPSGGSGTEYYFKIKINTSDKIIFDSAWINNKSFELFIAKETTTISNAPIKYEKGDIITLRVSDLKNKNTKTVISKPPIEHNGAALIGYTVKNKQEYFIIKEINKQASLNHQ